MNIDDLRDFTLPNGKRYIETENRVYAPVCGGRDCVFWKTSGCSMNNTLMSIECIPGTSWHEIDDDGYVLGNDGYRYGTLYGEILDVRMLIRIDKNRNRIDVNGNSLGYKY